MSISENQVYSVTDKFNSFKTLCCNIFKYNRLITITLEELSFKSVYVPQKKGCYG